MIPFDSIRFDSILFETSLSNRSSERKKMGRDAIALNIAIVIELLQPYLLELKFVRCCLLSIRKNTSIPWV